MTGLETIVEQILQEAQKEAEEIKAQAARTVQQSFYTLRFSLSISKVTLHIIIGKVRDIFRLKLLSYHRICKPCPL